MWNELEVTVYRGMNETEYNLRNAKSSKDSLYNISWWSEDLLTAQLYATYAVAKCVINVDSIQQVNFQSGARGNLESYKGFGINELKAYSISKDYFEKNKISLEFLVGKEIVPSFIDLNESSLNSLPDEEITLIKHVFDTDSGVKISIKYELLKKDEFKERMRSNNITQNIAKIKDDTVQVYYFI